MKLDRGEARNSTASAISAAYAVRPRGNARPSSSLVSPHSASTPSVRVGQGATLLTRTPCAEFDGPGPGQRFHLGLGGAVSGCAGYAFERDHGRDVDDAAAATLEHPRHQAGDQEVCPADVGVEDRLEDGDVLVDGGGAGEVRRVVHDDVDASALLHEGLHRIHVGQIGLNEARVLTDPAAAFSPRSRSRPEMMTSAPSAGHQTRRLPADTRGTTGDQGGVIGQLHEFSLSGPSRQRTLGSP